MKPCNNSQSKICIQQDNGAELFLTFTNDRKYKFKIFGWLFCLSIENSLNTLKKIIGMEKSRDAGRKWKVNEAAHVREILCYQLENICYCLENIVIGRNTFVISWKTLLSAPEKMQKKLETEQTDKDCICNRHMLQRESRQFHAICQRNLLKGR